MKVRRRFRIIIFSPVAAAAYTVYSNTRDAIVLHDDFTYNYLLFNNYNYNNNTNNNYYYYHYYYYGYYTYTVHTVLQVRNNIPWGTEAI